MNEPDFSPRLDGAELAISAGRRRRHHRQLGSASAVAAVAVLAMVVAAGPFHPQRGRDSIQVAGDPAASSEPTPDPSASAAPSADPTAEPTADPSANAGGGPQPVGGGSGGGEYGDPTAEPDDSASPDPSDDTAERVSAQPVESVVPYSAGEDCAASPVPIGGPPQWCARYSGDTKASRGGVATISVDLCRPAGTGQGEVIFSDEDGITMEISGSETVWTSRDGRTVAKAHDTETVEEGTCLRWTTTWDTRDRDGFRVRPGDYSVSYSIEGDAGWSGSYGSLTVS